VTPAVASSTAAAGASHRASTTTTAITTASTVIVVSTATVATSAPITSATSTVALVAGHARFLAHARRRLLHPDLAAVEVVAVQLPQDLFDLAPPGVRVDVDEPKVLDDVGLHHRGVPAEQVLQAGRGRPLGQVAHEKLGRRLPRPSRLTLFNLDVPAFDHCAVQALNSFAGLFAVVHVDKGVVLDALAFCHCAELFEKGSEVVGGDVPGLAEVADVQLHGL